MILMATLSDPEEYNFLKADWTTSSSSVSKSSCKELLWSTIPKFRKLWKPKIYKFGKNSISDKTWREFTWSYVLTLSNVNIHIILYEYRVLLLEMLYNMGYMHYINSLKSETFWNMNVFGPKNFRYVSVDLYMARLL